MHLQVSLVLDVGVCNVSRFPHFFSTDIHKAAKHLVADSDTSKKSSFLISCISPLEDASAILPVGPHKAVAEVSKIGSL